MSNRLGIDKVALLFPTENLRFDPDFAGLEGVNIDNRTNPVTGEPKYKTVLYRDESGKDILGRSLSFGEDYQLQIQSGNRTKESLSFVQFSGAAFRETNAQSLTRDEVFDVSNQIQTDLKERGVSVDLSKGILYRLDITPTLEMNEPIAHYAPIFSGIGTRKRTRKVEFGETGFYLGNKSWEAAFYDKGNQMRERYGSDFGIAENSLRPELRFLTASKLKSYLPIGSLPELSSQWGAMTNVYRDVMEKEIFKKEYRVDQPAALDWERLAKQASQNERNKWQTFKSSALAALMVKDMGLDRAKTFVAESFGFDPDTEAGKRQLDRIHRELSIAAFHLATEGESPMGTGMRELYKELKSKVLSCKV